MSRSLRRKFNVIFIVLVLFNFVGIKASVNIISEGKPLPLWYPGNINVVNTAINLYVSDSRSVCGNSPNIIKDSSVSCIVIGTLGYDTEFDGFVSKTNIELEGIRNRWEAYHIEETDMLGRVIKDQRSMISSYFKCSPNKIPQIFVPYKEVLKAYNNGLELPEDISLVWCDDNHGYITRLSDKEEQKRTGGAGVYYHISYWGKPHDYLWLASTQPGLIYKEMKRAWDYNSRRLWVLNVGDIKPGEYLINFFLDMAWDVDFVDSENVYSHQKEWYSSIFGNSIGGELNKIMKDYYRLSAERKPEHMGWSYVESSKPGAVGGLTPVVDTDYNPFAERDEVSNRISEYSNLVGRVNKIRDIIPADRRESFFELIEYPVKASSAMDEKLLYAQLARTYSQYGLPVAKEYELLSENAYNKLTELAHYYNKVLLKGKWDGMVDISPRNLPVFRKPEFLEYPVKSSDEIKVHVEGASSLCDTDVPIRLVLSDRNFKTSRISFFDSSLKRLSWNVVKCPLGVSVSELPNGLTHRIDLSVTIDDKKFSTSTPENLVISLGNKEIIFNLSYKNLSSDLNGEFNKYISFNASDFSLSKGAVKYHEGLGHSGKSVSVPASEKIGKSFSFLEYDFITESVGDANIMIGTIPVHPANNGDDVRIAVVVDDCKPKVISLKSDFLTEKWITNVLRNQVLTEFKYSFNEVGKHTIRLYALDDDICFDQLKVDFDVNRKSYILN